MGGLVDWGAGANMDPEGPRGVFKSAIEGAEKGYELGQKRAQVHALQGIDLNDANSVDAGIGNLVRANAAEQANALQNLSLTRSIRQQLPAIMQKFQGVGQDQQPQAAPASADTPAQGDPQHAVETLTLAKGAADKLLSTPASDRPAMAAQIKQEMLARHVPEEAIDSALTDLSDQGLQGLSAHYGELVAHAQHQMSPQAGAVAPPVPQAHASNSWAMQLLQDPQFALMANMAKVGGADMFSGVMENARALAGPEIAQAAEAKYAGPIAATRAGVDVAKADAMVPVNARQAAATEAATMPYKVALNKATADIAAGHDFISLPEIGADGQPTGKTLTYRKDQAIAAGGKGPVGATRSPEDQANKTADAAMFMRNYETDGNPDAIRSDVNARDNALAAARMAQTLNPSNLTPWLAKNANTLNGLGIKIVAADANKFATYENLLSKNVKDAIAVFPKNEVEFHAISGALPNLKTPGDAAALTLTTLAAVKNAQIAQKQFRVDWAAKNPGKYSESEFRTAWDKRPESTQSFLASPLFQDLKMSDGKPATVIYPTSKDGHVYGVFLPGTKQASTFRVR